MGFCSEEQATKFLEAVPAVERAMVDSGIILLQQPGRACPDEQTRRLESRIDDPRKVRKLSDMDLNSRTAWYYYWRARRDVPWSDCWALYIADTNYKKRGQLYIITHLLSQVPDQSARTTRHQAAQATGGPRA